MGTSGFYHFCGTGREPTLLPYFNDECEPVPIPFYELIHQTGLDMQVVAGNWLLKLEALYRNGQGDDFFAGVGGFEYTFVRVAGTSADLGVIGQYAYDERGEYATTPYENDAMLGLRLAPNDPASSEELAGVIQDIKSSALALRIEASRRNGSKWRVSLETWTFFSLPDDDLFYGLRNDDFLRLEAAYYF